MLCSAASFSGVFVGRGQLCSATSVPLNVVSPGERNR